LISCRFEGRFLICNPAQGSIVQPFYSLLSIPAGKQVPAEVTGVSTTGDGGSGSSACVLPGARLLAFPSNIRLDRKNKRRTSLGRRVCAGH
jgi:hypothetical protein